MLFQITRFPQTRAVESEPETRNCEWLGLEPKTHSDSGTKVEPEPVI